MLLASYIWKFEVTSFWTKTSQTVTRTAQAAITAYEESLPQHDVDLWLLETSTYF